MLNREIAIKTIKDFVIACRKNNIYFSKVILFGSVAAGRIHEYSDIDIAVVSDQFTRNSIANWHMLSPIVVSNHNFTAIEPHPFPEDYFEKGDPFINEIKKTGIEVLV